MDGTSLFFPISLVLGGLALFIFGMSLMSDGLRTVAGSGLRSLLTRTTANRFAGLGLGTLLGFLVHSSAASVMLVGFMNAGLLSLEQTVAPMLGTNLGTSLSMQLVSFKLTDYCYVGIVFGLLLQMVGPGRLKATGRALIGFGLLFLGMRTMSEAIHPYRDVLSQYLRLIDGHTLSGRLLGVAIAFGITAIIQSSGATIGISFSLADAGVFDSLWEIYPIIIGAQIGTCATALLGSIGTQIDARRAAAGNLGTNLCNAVISIALAPLWIPLFEKTSADLVRQAANTHTLLMIQNCLVFLPLARPYAHILRRIIPSKTPPPAPSFLVPALLAYPEQALSACIQELRRIAATCERSLRLAGRALLFAQTSRDIQTVRLNEQIINDIKLAMRGYLTRLAHQSLSRRQAILLQYIDQCTDDLERIGDHIERFVDLSLSRRQSPAAIVGADLFDALFLLYEKTLQLFQRVELSLDPSAGRISETADHILHARDEFIKTSEAIRAKFNQNIFEHRIAPIAGLYFGEYMAVLNRIVRHTRSIALAELRPQFWLKPSKFPRQASPLRTDFASEPLVDPAPYLARLSPPCSPPPAEPAEPPV